ncbi:universal stress protein [Pyruvatibacter sp.]|uniref:universal stress protein n=1 Tax=Pyruvatibacter sp. TaxID=1981328 RepID=UPI0032EDFF38
MLKTIALIDGSVYGQSVCDAAAWVAHRTGASVDLLHVLGRRDGAGGVTDLSGSIGLGARTALLEELAELDAQKARLAQKRGRALLDDAKQRLQAAGVETVSTQLRYGDLAETVQEFERDAHLLVLGKRGEAADFAKLHLGSNLERVVRSTRRPILVASRTFKPVERFLIAFDGGASATKAIDHIVRGNMFSGLPCTLLMVGREDASSRGQLEIAANTLRDGGFSVDARIEAGQPENVISQAVERDGIDMLVMGAYGHSRIRTLIIGSTTTEMIRSCMIPIMLFR